MQPKAPSNPGAPQSGMDLLLDLGINSSVTRPSAPQGGNDAWDDFARFVFLVVLYYLLVNFSRPDVDFLLLLFLS